MQTRIVGMLTSYPDITQSDWLWQQTPQPFGCLGQNSNAGSSATARFLAAL
jgi:hypothetical protein